MKKSSANFIWCITYTTAKKIPVKMAAMKVIVLVVAHADIAEPGVAFGDAKVVWEAHKPSA